MDRAVRARWGERRRCSEEEEAASMARHSGYATEEKVRDWNRRSFNSKFPFLGASMIDSRKFRYNMRPHSANIEINRCYCIYREDTCQSAPHKSHLLFAICIVRLSMYIWSVAFPDANFSMSFRADCTLACNAISSLSSSAG